MSNLETVATPVRVSANQIRYVFREAYSDRVVLHSRADPCGNGVGETPTFAEYVQDAADSRDRDIAVDRCSFCGDRIHADTSDDSGAYAEPPDTEDGGIGQAVDIERYELVHAIASAQSVHQVERELYGKLDRADLEALLEELGYLAALQRGGCNADRDEIMQTVKEVVA